MRIKEGLFRQVLDRSGQAIFVSLAETGDPVDVNQTALDWLGYTRAEFLEIGVKGIEVGYPIQTLAQWKQHINEMREAGQPRHFKDGQLRRKDGTTFLVEVSVSLHTFEGVEYAIGVSRDVSAERAAEEELRLTQLAVDTAAEAMFRVGPDARILASNRTACERLGYTEEEILNMRVFDFDPDYGPEIWHEHWEEIRENKRLIVETTHRKKDGTLFPVEVSITYIPAGLFHEEHCCSFIRDISQRRELEKRLRLADRVTTIGTLAAGVAHEINNPLQYVMLNFDALTRTAGLDGATREALADAYEGCVRIRDIVAELQALSRADEGKTSAVSVHSVLSFALKIARTHFRHRARLREERSSREPFVIANSGQLGQVLLNIIVNAAQAFAGDHPDNAIVVRTRFEGPSAEERVIVEISDNGAGIPEEMMTRIYDAFFTTKPPGVGTGLGLAISQSIVAGAGGSLDVFSRLGEGTTVTVSLPSAMRPTSRPPLSLGRTPCKALIVDDDPAVVRAFSRTLDDFFLETATDGDSALRLLREVDFDVVLCDVMMPGLSGPELYKLAVESSPRWKARFVFVTGGACTDDAKRFLDETECLCLAKPVSPGELRATLNKFSKTS